MTVLVKTLVEAAQALEWCYNATGFIYKTEATSGGSDAGNQYVQSIGDDSVQIAKEMNAIEIPCNTTSALSFSELISCMFVGENDHGSDLGSSSVWAAISTAVGDQLSKLTEAATETVGEAPGTTCGDDTPIAAYIMLGCGIAVGLLAMVCYCYNKKKPAEPSNGAGAPLDAYVPLAPDA